MKKIAVLGCGTVGSGIVEVFYKNRPNIESKAGCTLDIKSIYVRRPHPELAYQDKLCFDFEEIANDPEINIVCEVMGGIEPAFTFIKTCLSNGKSVVTANKELIAQKGAELLSLAKSHNTNILFEASVGGGIPIISPLHQCLGANQIQEIKGILNGTTNFILTQMVQKNMSFQDALQQAQELGYAEADPSADVMGLDACRKICILASLAFGRHVYPEYVRCEGISDITLEDVEYAKNWGGVIKLIGKASMRENGQLTMLTAPMLVSDKSQLSRIDDVFNGILVTGNAVGDVLFYGRGAGKLPTASAVVSDIIDCAKASGTISTLSWKDSAENFVENWKVCPAQFYLRLKLKDARQVKIVLDTLENAQLLHRENQPDTELAMIVPACTPMEIESVLEKFKTEGIQLLGRIFLA